MQFTPKRCSKSGHKQTLRGPTVTDRLVLQSVYYGATKADTGESLRMLTQNPISFTAGTHYSLPLIFCLSQLAEEPIWKTS